MMVGIKQGLVANSHTISLLMGTTYLVVYNLYICKTLVSMKKHEEKKKNSHRVQTTQDVSFGPVFIVPALPISYLVENNLFAL